LEEWINSFTEGIDMDLKAAGSPVTIQALCRALWSEAQVWQTAAQTGMRLLLVFWGARASALPPGFTRRGALRIQRRSRH
jgi:hypothetical protein